jgi:hypothetical protein
MRQEEFGSVVLIAVVMTALLSSIHLWGVGFPVARWLQVPSSLVPIAGCGVVLTEGYVIFWAYFFSHALGTLLTLAASLVAIALAVWRWRGDRRKQRRRLEGEFDWVALSLVVGVLFLAMLFLFHDSRPAGEVATDRFVTHLPVDNRIPQMFADRLQGGLDPRKLLGDEWQSSDRPPLQTGFILMTRPLLGHLHLTSTSLAFGASFLFELMWVPALWGLLRIIGASRRLACFGVAAVACTGFALVESVYTWPKLGGAALCLGGLAIVLDRRRSLAPRLAAVAGGLTALAQLSHGGLMFSTIATVGLLCVRRYRPSLRSLGAMALVAVVLMASWSAYQKWVEPPGNQLLKLHLAGVVQRDARGVWQSVKDSYSSLGVNGSLHYKAKNLHTLVRGRARTLLDLGGTAAERRSDDFYYLRGTLAWAPIAAVLVLVLRLRDRRRAARGDTGSVVGSSGAPSGLEHVGALVVWAVVTVAVWTVLMFGPGTTFVHQGSFAPILVLLALPFVALGGRAPRLAVGIWGAQTVLFLRTWMPSSGTSGHAVRPAAVVLVLLSVVLLVAAVAQLPKRRQLPAAGV